MTIRELAEKHRDYIIGLRREFHQYPEMSLKETRTTRRIEEELTAMGIEVETFPDIPGCIGILKGKKPGRTVAWRADIDGLPLIEKSKLPYTSKCDGVMHACGHDCHTSAALGAAKILSELRGELCGTVKFFFQSGEEMIIGARRAVENGVFDDVDFCMGMHVLGSLPSGTYNMALGARMSASDSFFITVKGSPAHSSLPHEGRDAIVAASAIVVNLQQMVSRYYDPLKPLVCGVGMVNGGKRFNMVADEVKMEGTVRTYERRAERAQIAKRIKEIAESTAKAYGCTAEVNYEYWLEPIINENREMVSLVREGVMDLYGESALVEMDKLSSSEDFCFIMEKVPSVFGYFGVCSDKVEGSGEALHSESFMPDDTYLHRASGIAARSLFDYLKKNG